MLTRPSGFDQRVGESQRENILHGLFAEEVVDAIHPLLFEDTFERRVKVT